jgi:anti-anti-sigma factor
MHITSTTVDQAVILAVTGDIDADSFSQVVHEADRHLEVGQVRLVLDLSGVNYISSAGLVALQTIAGRASARGGKLVLCAVNSRVRQVFEMSGFHQLLAIFPDQVAALASL